MNRSLPPWAWLDLPAPHQRAFDADGSWDRRTLADLAYARAAKEPDAAVLIDAERVVTVAELHADAEALAIALHRRGLRQGDVIAFQLPNWAEAAVVNLAAVIDGLVVNPIVPIYRDAEVGMMLGDCSARALFVPAQFRNHDYVAMAGRLRPALPALDHVLTVRGSGADDLDTLIAEGRGESFNRPQVDARAVKMVLYTSGTTGRPKGCCTAMRRYSA